MQKKFEYGKLLQYFLQGMLILAPIAITFYAIFFVVTTIDSWLPIFRFKDNNGIEHTQNYGLGFVVIIVLILVIGYFSSFFITGRIVSFVDKLLQRAPGLKHIYGTTRDFFEAFAGDKKKFTHNVLVNVDSTDVWRLGFITREDMADFGLPGHVAVYVPMSYSVAGIVYLVPPEKLRLIENINSAQTMKFAVSGGVTSILDSDETETEITHQPPGEIEEL